MSEQNNKKVGIVGYLALIFACVFFSGTLTGSNAWYSVFDFATLNGTFGKMLAGVTLNGDTLQTVATNFRGKGGAGALDGFIFAVTLAPTVMFALASITVLEHYGALDAARQLLTPVLRPLVGIPGSCCLAFISSLQSTDGGAAMSRQLKDSGEITEDEADIFAMLQLSGDATLANFMGSGLVLLSLTGANGETVPVTLGACLVVTFIMKFFGANLARFIFMFQRKKSA
ncbi:MAG: nucleoside recognition domain-containing protein [Candidatus Aphodousia sp.]|nr:hypothetical protein [Sutterella sp.]MDY2899650.1 nucleoside recognition domain-containing protein [Candidatus Aphodousia sp.]